MLEFFDSNCMLGRSNGIREGALVSTRDIQSKMKDCGVTRAIAYHDIAADCDVLLGNAQICEETVGNSHFLRQWVVMPDMCGDFPEPDTLVSEMKQNDVCSVRLFPLKGKYSLRPYAAGRLIHTLSYYHIPIFIDRQQIPFWDDLYTLCTDYAQATFILCNTDYGNLHQLYPILSECKGLYVESGTFVDYGGIEDFCQRFGAGRLVFGSGAPVFSIASAVTLIRYADITEHEKESIAFGNMERILSEVTL